MSGAELGLILSVFLACAVETVEAVTIVLAMGLSRGWRSAWAGVAAGLLVLTVIVAVLGPAVTSLPLTTLRLIVGGLLLTFGLQWLRKAIMRASGLKALHDEDAIFARERAEAQAAGVPDTEGIDRYGFLIAFKGVVLEGLEVVFIVLTFGANQGNVGAAAIGAAAAVVFVVVAAVAVRAPLSRVPENTMKFSVGVMLASFGSFWGAEGAGVDWPGGDAALAGVVAFILLTSLGIVAWLRRPEPTADPKVAS